MRQPFFALIEYRGVYSEFFYKRGKKARIIAIARAAYIVNRGKRGK